MNTTFYKYQVTYERENKKELTHSFYSEKKVTEEKFLKNFNRIGESHFVGKSCNYIGEETHNPNIKVGNTKLVFKFID